MSVKGRRFDGKRCRIIAEVLDHIAEGVVILNGEFRVLGVNPAFVAITGYESAEVKGRRPPFLKALARAPGLYASMRRALAGVGRWEGDFWGRRKQGDEVALHLSIATIASRSGSDRATPPTSGAARQYAVVITDVTQRKRDEERTFYEANFDGLTRLPNRRLFQDRLQQALAGAARSGSKLALLFIDLDGFKSVNDALGHDFGDRLLSEAAERLARCVRAGDTIARLGGDEFTVIMPRVEDAEDAGAVSGRILEALGTPFVLDGQDAFVSASIGITIYPDDGGEAGELLKNADTAMYRAKAEGKANYQFFTPGLDVDVRDRLAIRSGLYKAVEREELELHYQPKVDLRTRRMVGVEALLRWRHPTLGAVSPARFVPILEESSLIVDVGLWALRRACRQHLAWREDAMPAIRIAVNLSARQLREPSFVKHFEQVLRETGVGPEGVEVEITESMLMTDHQRVTRALCALRDMGVRIAIDDFGTGYSSLSYLKRFPLDTIKIDRSFVSDITRRSDDAEIIRTIISIGHVLNRHVVAEGVETEDQARLLAGYGCQQIQGYLVSPPLAAGRLAEFLRANPGVAPIAPGGTSSHEASRGAASDVAPRNGSSRAAAGGAPSIEPARRSSVSPSPHSSSRAMADGEAGDGVG